MRVNNRAIFLLNYEKIRDIVDLPIQSSPYFAALKRYCDAKCPALANIGGLDALRW
jgi:hypothetical protein